MNSVIRLFSPVFSVLILLCSNLYAVEPIEIETRIGREIRQELEKMADLHAHRIVIRDHGKRITLLGDVSTEKDRQRVEQVALSIPGVKCVHNLLQVSPDETGHELARNIQKDIMETDLEGGCDLDIIVNRGVVTLRGKVENREDAKVVVKLAEARAGEGKVINQLGFGATLSDDDLRQHIMQALQAESGLNLTNLNVSVENGTALFSGTCKNHREIDEILAIALMVPGISNIESKLRIGNKEY